MSVLYNTYKLLPRFINNKLSMYGLVKPAPPINLTFSVTNLCNSKCRTCSIWKVYPEHRMSVKDELSLEEIEKIFKSIGPIYFFNISGGEPFLRKDLTEIIELGCEYLKPQVIHTPTNGILPERIEIDVRKILKMMQKINYKNPFTIKPSFDGIGEKHDNIRGVQRNFENVLETIKKLKNLQKEFPQLHVGLGTVISKFNVNDIGEIMNFVEKLGVDTYINEIAEVRTEMFDQEEGITPTWDLYEKAIQLFQKQVRKNLKTKKGLARITQSFRLYYYNLVVKILKEKYQVIPCYAGISNAHISPYGDVWPCCVLGYEKSFGNLRDVNYNFKKIWHSNKAKIIRKSIKNKDCYCPLANQAYANILYNFPALIQVIRDIF
ncbi:MAG: radical SAM protein [Candidatus Schekmanbacteria bacterium RBG_13_48_7]|uniref:Radical SAM protein n=1 Tax=Candidatus Schekmanbacteria bacterium RBG_13_48_7 TaxID=1817878 RepID=A0A1F7RVW6_9BACT|nr:MAG: radical SAM protein [Candidatus Schekmanbacteria bacterium RBG_13_48_7]